MKNEKHDALHLAYSCYVSILDHIEKLESRLDAEILIDLDFDIWVNGTKYSRKRLEKIYVDSVGKG